MTEIHRHYNPLLTKAKVVGGGGVGPTPEFWVVFMGTQLVQKPQTQLNPQLSKERGGSVIS